MEALNSAAGSTHPTFVGQPAVLLASARVKNPFQKIES
jgi:hypothetical protein